MGSFVPSFEYSLYSSSSSLSSGNWPDPSAGAGSFFCASSASCAGSAPKFSLPWNAAFCSRSLLSFCTIVVPCSSSLDADERLLRAVSCSVCNEVRFMSCKPMSSRMISSNASSSALTFASSSSTRVFTILRLSRACEFVRCRTVSRLPDTRKEIASIDLLNCVVTQRRRASRARNSNGLQLSCSSSRSSMCSSPLDDLSSTISRMIGKFSMEEPPSL
mmetsp:Transcript_13618/g.49509  ORF Transcript_13618/g.49509 Transcript_13618/m.49509 type:complete len:218 (-) Transcript_13618:1358-2011(-)